MNGMVFHNRPRRRVKTALDADKLLVPSPIDAPHGDPTRWPDGGGLMGHLTDDEVPASSLPRRIVVAFGGNALIRREQRGEYREQRANIEIAADAIVSLAELVPEIVVTHGNGPQIGFLALQCEAAAPKVPSFPLDVLGAESQGQIGYMLAQAIVNRLTSKGMNREVAVILTQVVVAANDPAFARPTKPVGPVYGKAEAIRLQADRGWSIAPDNEHWRRVVPSPAPRRIVEAESIRTLVKTGTLVIASGGGGIPVVEGDGRRVDGVEAVIDKDLAAVVLARSVEADGLILLTDVDGVYREWRSPSARRIESMSLAEGEELLDSGTLPTGSMAPKVRACLQFMRGGGRFAAIGALDEAVKVLRGTAGTVIGGRPIPEREVALPLHGMRGGVASALVHPK